MRVIFAVLVAALAVLPAFALFAQGKGSKAAKRVQPPKFGKSDVFYADAFKEGLVGERPANLGQGGSANVSSAAKVPDSGGRDTSAGSASPVGGAGWSRLISAGTIEDSIKALRLQVDRAVTTPSEFAGNGHKLARRDYSLLAVLFGIAGEYDGDVRWKKDAPVARDAFARSAANFKVGTPQAFQEAKLRKDELAQLVGGSSPYAGKEADTKANWGQVANRGPLMQSLELAWEPRLKPALADKNQFTAKADVVLRDAELFAAMGEVLARDGMPDADSDEYKAFSARLRDGAKAIIDAVKTKNFEQAASGAATVSKACAECHENYRS
jgi:hypothetical protein